MKSKETRGRPQRNIWAPWRMEYILADKAGGCFLCDKFREKTDRINHVLFRGRSCAVAVNRFPYAPGHLMIAPLRHVAQLTAMTRAELREMMELTARCSGILERTMHPHGFNIGINIGDAAGAGLKDHIHMHIVPRWTGDTNFMPVLADVKVMPQALDEIWDALHAHFKKT